MKTLNKAMPQSPKLAGWVAVLTAVLNLLWVANYWGGILQSTRDSITQGGTGGLVDQSMIRMHLMIEAALIIAALGLLSRKITGIVISAMALIWVGIEYIGWFIWTQRTIEAAGLTAIPRFIPHAANLYGATGWNIAILVIVVALFVWEVKMLTGVFIVSQRNGTR